ncbi:hypothetical protein C9974_12150 [Marinobacter sp. B9-2]|nr:hypothetical protein C9974_12150 [Marinobacter sp. B9-2]
MTIRYVIEFDDRELLPDKLAAEASKLGLSVEQLIKRFIVDGMEELSSEEGPAELGENWEDFLVKNGVWRKGSSGE